MTDTVIEPGMEEPGPAVHEDIYEAPEPSQNFPLAVAAGLGAALVGAVLWAAFTYVTGYELGLIAVALGAFVGIAIRKAGNGREAHFAFLGVVCAALGCLLGIILSYDAFLAKEAGQPFLSTMAQLGVGGSIELALKAGSPMDFLFIAIAIWEAFKFSTRHGR